MSRIEQIELEIKGLSPEELKEFRGWFARYDAELWDRQIEADARNGKLLSLASRALRTFSQEHRKEVRGEDRSAFLHKPTKTQESWHGGATPADVAP